jgi:hypothetical protein
MQVIHNLREHVLDKYRKLLAEEGKMLAEEPAQRPTPKLIARGGKVVEFQAAQREERGDE